MDIQQKIEEMITVCLEAPEYADCFVVEVRTNPNGNVQIFVDSDEGMTLDRCKQISRRVERMIDDSGLFGGKYSLEVSSPGADRPLIMRRQYPQHIGRTLTVRMPNDGTSEGMLEEVTETGLLLKSDDTENGSREIAWDDIVESIVQIRFK